MQNSLPKGAIPVITGEQSLCAITVLIIDRGKQDFHILEMAQKKGANANPGTIGSLLSCGNEVTFLHQRQARIDDGLLAALAVRSAAIYPPLPLLIPTSAQSFPCKSNAFIHSYCIISY
jgi:hypothetical protein